MSRAFHNPLNGVERQTRKVLCCLTVLTISTLLIIPASAQQQTQIARDKHTEKIRKYIKTLKRWDVGDPVTVKLNDGTTLKGRISEVADDYFVVIDRKTRQSSSIDYTQVDEIREGMGTRTKIGIAFGGAVLAIVGICAATHGCRE